MNEISLLLLLLLLSYRPCYYYSCSLFLVFFLFVARIPTCETRNGYRRKLRYSEAIIARELKEKDRLDLNKHVKRNINTQKNPIPLHHTPGLCFPDPLTDMCVCVCVREGEENPKWAENSTSMVYMHVGSSFAGKNTSALRN